jgi:hypothetical protein
MGLADIAAGVAVTTEQRDRGVATVDETAAALADRLVEYDDALPCSPTAAATVVDAYAAGRSVGDAARVAEMAPMTAAKTLHLLGEAVQPVGPVGRDVIGDWLAGRLSRSEATTLAGVTDREFALAVYVLTHEPIPGAREAVAATLRPERNGLVDGLADAVGDGSHRRER